MHQGNGGGRQVQRLPQAIAETVLVGAAAQFRRHLAGIEVRAQVDRQVGVAVAGNRVAQRGADSVDGAAFQAIARRHQFALHVATGKADGDILQRRASEFVGERGRPGDLETGIGRLEGCQLHTPVGQVCRPAAVAAEPRPRGATQRQDSDVGLDIQAADRRGEDQLFVVPAQPVVAQVQGDALVGQSLEPGAQQGRGLHRLGEDAAGTADEGVRAQAIGPVAQGLGRKGIERGAQGLAGLAVAPDKAFERFGVGQVQSAAAGHQELARHRRHAVVEVDAQTRLA